VGKDEQSERGRKRWRGKEIEEITKSATKSYAGQAGARAEENVGAMRGNGLKVVAL